VFPVPLVPGILKLTAETLPNSLAELLTVTPKVAWSVDEALDFMWRYHKWWGDLEAPGRDR
jgi:hypothetical protein